ncbi:MAG: hypothetical protein IJA27_07380 [Lachnospiraceae bacterium]|nr:hypothetical protein [Lachnospiraceae bacterium]
MKVIVKIDGRDIKEMSPEEKIEVADALNRQALLASGYIEVNKRKKKGA